MTTETLTPEAVDSPEPAPTATRSKRRTGTSRPVRRFLIVTHRWLSLVLGLVLLVITTSGAVLVYEPELNRWMNSDAYDVSGKPATTTLNQAKDTVLAAHPDFAATSVWFEHGVYRVTDDVTSWTVDPGTGEVLGHVGETPTWLKVMEQVHMCFFSCEEEPAFVGFMMNEIPGTAWLGHDDVKVTYGALVLGVFGLFLLYLSITGLWLWFPRRGKRPGKWKKSVSVRWKKGRFARDTDLHNLAGLIAVPLLLLWAVTGMSYEFEFVETGWYQATPGEYTEVEDPGSATWMPLDDAGEPVLPIDAAARPADITPDQAVAAAVAAFPGAKLTSVIYPTEPDATLLDADPEHPDEVPAGLEDYNASDLGSYYLWFSDGYDSWANGEYPGDLGVSVDRRTGVATATYGMRDEPVAQRIFEDFNYPVHSGYFVNGWWKIIWFVIGLAPLLLAATGVSTWLVRRKTKKNRKQAEA